MKTRKRAAPSRKSPTRSKPINEILGTAQSAFEKIIRSAPAGQQNAFRRDLGGLLVFLHHEQLVLKKGTQIHLSPNDSHEALFGAPLKQIRSRLRAARKALERLKTAVGSIPNFRPLDELETIAGHLDDYDRHVSATGKQKSPDFNRRVERIVQIVHEHTGGYKDDFVSEVLQQTCPGSRPVFPSAEALRTWRSSRGLKG